MDARQAGRSARSRRSDPCDSDHGHAGSIREERLERRPSLWCLELECLRERDGTNATGERAGIDGSVA